MKFLRSLTARIRRAVRYRWERITTNMPLRMKVGRFGIWLVKIGRTLQVCYANWNSELRMKVEVDRTISDYCTIHVSEEISQRKALSFPSPTAQSDKATPMVHALFGIKGVAAVTLSRYEIHIMKGRVFSWQELLPSIEKVVMEHLTAK
ncbi:MAG: hypothetical protein UT43_C0029G0007 [Parcubacteria group bacterium GW2011_GWC1_39_29]|uniref:Scaffold protein Nfu/NifU N-terminal domain-containing protein n=1 Tax=Candidatus Yanofskybacteria bacterium GW2011_GWD1_39_16 TaxID=1619030 RepID=A0A837HSL7_9BACT|nr:MAG: hypothetical protein UT35_C0029G0005 [Candidatus Yanofskybacteria bacterium GW2011_GWD1_39_16]KKR14254.1 MAG: hypothetical protein UT43_C0029G0007 [Parcubacteria group bacterium GW2011_GWC1_39_29]